MQVFKSVFFVFTLTGTLAFAQNESPRPKSRTIQMKSLGISFASWNEILTAESGTASSKVFSNHYVNNITYTQDRFTGRTGYSMNYSLILGKATLAPAAVSYASADKSFFGVSFYPRYSYRQSAAITFGIGPLLMYRSLKWDPQNSVTISTSPQANVGILGSVDFRLNPRIEVVQTLGTLFLQANTYWSLGLGYNF